MNGIIQEMLTPLKSEADRYSIDMGSELAAELRKIVGDRVQLQQVFMNLMLNGIEAMTDSGGELMVSSQCQDSQLLFSVSDNGAATRRKWDRLFRFLYHKAARQRDGARDQPFQHDFQMGRWACLFSLLPSNACGALRSKKGKCYTPASNVE